MGSRLQQKSNSTRKRIENHHFDDEQGEEYEASSFGGFPEYFRRKKIKLQNLDAELRAQSGHCPQIFRGVVVHVNGYTQPSLADLHSMIVQHGGGFIQYLDGKTMVTHIIASNLTPKKKEEFKRYRIVKPAWIVDSIKAEKILPWDEYRVIDEGVSQKTLVRKNGSIMSRVSSKTCGYREQTDTSWYTEQMLPQHAVPLEQHDPIRTVTSPAQSKSIGSDEDDYLSSEITSSVEQALNDADQISAISSIKVAKVQNSTANDMEEGLPRQNSLGDMVVIDSPLHGRNEVAENSAIHVDDSSILRPRQGSQEPDFSHAVIRDSEVLKNISASKLASMSAEEHNSLLLSDPNIRKSTVINPEFLDQYYRESRLHHLSTWKADLKAQLQAIAAENSLSQKSKYKKLPGQRRYILHVDFDCFFAAVSLKKYPQCKDKPAAVAHGAGSGSEIASCNYAARAFGVSNGMWMKRAQQLCPELKVLPYDFPAYEDASRKFYDAIMATGGLVQSVSIDEALVDVSTICFARSGSDGVKRHEGAVHREQSEADEMAQELRDEILGRTGCAVSIGIGGNILQARIALRKAKPAGQYQLKPEDVLDFIGQLEVTKLPGVAWSIGGKLEEIGIKLVKDIRDVSKERLAKALGPKTGQKIWEYSRGIDKTELGEQTIRKSVSAEVNWGVRFENQEQVDSFMDGLCSELNKRLLKEHVKGRQLTVKVMKRAADAPLDPPKHLGHGKCDVFNKSIQLGVATNDHRLLAKEAVAVMRSFAISPGELRGIGVQMQKLEPLKQGAGGLDLASQRKLQWETDSRANSNKTVACSAGNGKQDDIQTEVRQSSTDVINRGPSFVLNGPDTSGETSLNTTGTQFLMPTQIDHAVLKELPAEIRTRLAKQARPSSAHGRAADSDVFPRGPSSAIALPPQSQIDPSIFEALPEDLRNELLGFYQSPHRRLEKHGDQTLLPQSPHRIKATSAAKGPFARRGRGRPRGSRNLFSSSMRKGGSKVESSTLTQSNFVARQPHRDGGSTTDPETEVEDFDPDVLAALPDELREEVLAQHRRARLQRTSGIDVTLNQRFRAVRRKKTDEIVQPDRHFALPPLRLKPTFTSSRLCELPQLRNAIRAWFREFHDSAPFAEDVAALAKYLRDVVIGERDVDKAVAVVRWVKWIVENEEDISKDVRSAWQEAVEECQRVVQDAGLQRGLGRIIFD